MKEAIFNFQEHLLGNIRYHCPRVFSRDSVAKNLYIYKENFRDRVFFLFKQVLKLKLCLNDFITGIFLGIF